MECKLEFRISASVVLRASTFVISVSLSPYDFPFRSRKWKKLIPKNPVFFEKNRHPQHLD
jgi:hypothetical protein